MVGSILAPDILIDFTGEVAVRSGLKLGFGIWGVFSAGVWVVVGTGGPQPVNILAINKNTSRNMVTQSLT
jgi:hypothetical protein